MEQKNKAYRDLLTNVLKKQVILLGPEITLLKARNIKDLKIDDDFNVLNISNPPSETARELINQFLELSGFILEKTMESALAEYPQLALLQKDVETQKRS